MNARGRIAIAGVIFAACGLLPGPGLAQPAQPVPAAIDIKPIGKVLSISGLAHIDHPAAVVVQAKLSTGDTPAKIGDLVYQGDIIQTGSDGALSITFADGTS